MADELDEPESRWESLIAAADREDENTRERGGSWLPPILGPLVRAASTTRLRRLWPFTSLNRLCFSSGPRFWAGEGEVAPAFVEIRPDAQYLVVAASPYQPIPESMFDEAVPTADPELAARQVDEVLAGWTAS